MPKLNPSVKAWSVAAQRILDIEITAATKAGMPEAVIEQIKEKARHQAISDTFGANWKENLDIHGRPQADGIGSNFWAMRCEEGDLERHLQPILKYSGPAAYEAEKARIMKLRAGRGK
jgi:hypothetical protein